MGRLHSPLLLSLLFLLLVLGPGRDAAFALPREGGGSTDVGGGDSHGFFASPVEGGEFTDTEGGEFTAVEGGDSPGFFASAPAEGGEFTADKEGGDPTVSATPPRQGGGGSTAGQGGDDDESGGGGPQTGAGVNWDDVVDALLDQFRGQLEERGMSEVPLPPVDVQVKRRVLGSVPVRGRLLASDGRVADLTTLRRAGPALAVPSTPTTLRLAVPLTFTTLRLAYDRYQALGPLGLRSRGRLSATLPDNRFLLDLRLQSDDPPSRCRLHYDDVQVTGLDHVDVQVHVSGLRAVDRLASVVARAMARRLRQNLATALERLLHAQLVEVFANTELECA